MLLPKYEELVALKDVVSPLSLRQRFKVAATTSGSHTSLFKGRGLDFSEFREYAYGDDIRSIDWRVTARTRKPHTKLFVAERERSVYVIVDMNSYMRFGTRGTFKSIQAARAAAIIAWRASELNDKTGAVLFGDIQDAIRILPAKRTRRIIWDLLRQLSAEPHNLPNPHSILIEEALHRANRQIPTGSAVFILSDFFKLTTNFENELGRIAQRCDVTLVKITDPADLAIPDIATIRFEGETNSENRIQPRVGGSQPGKVPLDNSTALGEGLFDTSDRTAAAQYLKLAILRSQRLTEISHRFRARVIELKTNQDVVADLFHASTAQTRRLKR
jgi:uncharacterized protein (DUF58 family)